MVYQCLIILLIYFFTIVIIHYGETNSLNPKTFEPWSGIVLWQEELLASHDLSEVVKYNGLKLFHFLKY